jgi:hypothetical protein
MKKRLLTVLIITSILLGTGCGGIGNVKFKSGSYSRSADYMGIFDTEETVIDGNHISFDKEIYDKEKSKKLAIKISSDVKKIRDQDDVQYSQ